MSQCGDTQWRAGTIAHPVTHALYESRPLSLLTQREPLVVDATTSVDRVTELIATEKESALDEGFVVVDQGCYSGIGTITALLNLSVGKARDQIQELDIARAEAERLELEEDEVELGLLVEEARRTLIPRAKSKGLSLNFESDAEVDVHVDERKIIQVLLNLVNNAVKFTPEGGTVTLGDEVRPDGSVNLHVEDTGHGIPEGDMQRILEPFGRGRDSAIRQAEGAGIGLALTKVLVELHGGTLEVASAVGVGSRFTVRLPRRRVVRYRGTAAPSLAACGERG